MLETLGITILGALASTGLKVYFGVLLGSSGGAPIEYKRAELGYDVPKWYMNPGDDQKDFLGYGTSVVGDEFESVTDAKDKAVRQMVDTLRQSNKKLVQEKVKYDQANVKQRRLVELFVRGDGLEDFIRANAKVDKKQLVKVKNPEVDMRAFARVRLGAGVYLKEQEKQVHALATRLVKQNAEDVTSEMEAETESDSVEE